MTSNTPRTPEQCEPLWPRDRWLLVIVLLAALLGLIYNGVMIVGKGPDEMRHMGYVKLLLNEHRLPFLLANGNEYAGAHTFHPPLYYLLLLPFYAGSRWLPGDGAWHVVRLGSLLLCLGVLPLIYGIALKAGGNDRNVARLATAQVALLPMWGMTAGTINNDSGALFFVTCFLWLLTVRYQHDRSLRAALWLGVWMGLGTLCKGTALLCDGIALLVFLSARDGLAGWRSSRNWMTLGTVSAGVVVLDGWWHWRSLQLYHTFTPLPPSMPNPALPNPRNGPLVMMLHDNFPLLFAYANWSMLCTMWSQKDWIPESVRDYIYKVLAAYCLVGAAGSAVARVRRGDRNVSVDKTAHASLWSVYSAFTVNWIAVVQVAMFWHWGWAEGGRYMLPSLCGFSIFVARGWQTLLGSTRAVYCLACWLGLMLCLNALCIYWLLAYLNPTFG